MPETVRVVTDGEEMVLAQGEAFRVQTTPEPAVARRPDSAAHRLAIQYVGFKDADGRREYVLDARRGEEARRYTVWIELGAFSRREALFQEGPDISYQKLQRELAGDSSGSTLPGDDCIGVTASDLAAYRVAHAAPVRKSFSPARPPAPAAAEATSMTEAPEATEAATTDPSETTDPSDEPKSS